MESQESIEVAAGRADVGPGADDRWQVLADPGETNPRVCRSLVPTAPDPAEWPSL